MACTDLKTVNGLRFANILASDPDDKVSAATFHPTKEGYNQYSQALRQSLGYSGGGGGSSSDTDWNDPSTGYDPHYDNAGTMEMAY